MSMGLKANADGSGAVQVGGSDAITITSGLAVSLPTGNFSFNSGYGSSAVAYGCRAWVNFNGTGTVAIRASGNVSSITDGGVGIYTVNLTNAMPDADYAVCISTTYPGANDGYGVSGTPTTASFIINRAVNGSLADADKMYAAVFR